MEKAKIKTKTNAYAKLTHDDFASNHYKESGPLKYTIKQKIKKSHLKYP